MFKLHTFNCCNSQDVTFLQRKKLTEHASNVHKGRKKHLCPQCGKNFSEAGNLSKHIKAVHGYKQRNTGISDNCDTFHSKRYDKNV